MPAKISFEQKHQELADTLSRLGLLSEYERFIAWQQRQTFYLNVDGYDAYNKWMKSNKLSYQENKLKEAITAYAELTAYENKINQAEEMKDVIRRVIDIEITKLEIAQLRKLEKIQGIKRDNLKKLREELIEKRKTSNREIEEQTYKYSDRLYNTDAKNTREFFRQREERFHFGRLIRKIEKVTDALYVTDSSAAILTTVSTSLPGLLTIGQGLSTLFTAIPMVSMLLGGASHAFNMIKGLAQKKSNAKVLGPSITLMAMGGLAFGFLLVGIYAAPLAVVGLGCAMAGLGFVTGDAIPFVSSLYGLYKNNQKLNKLAQRANELKNASVVTLQPQERQMLLNKLEKDHMEAGADPTGEIEIIKALLSDATQQISITRQNTLFGRNLIDILVTENKKEQVKLNKQIIQHGNDAIGQGVKTILGICTLAGVILLSIPTPVTMILGASLIAASTLASVGIKYNWGSKIKGFFGKLFGGKEEEKQVEPTHTVDIESSEPLLINEVGNDRVSRQSHAVIIESLQTHKVNAPVGKLDNSVGTPSSVTVNFNQEPKGILPNQNFLPSSDNSSVSSQPEPAPQQPSPTKSS